MQAQKTARNSKLRYYIGVLFAVLFFGGFLVRSYWEEHVFKRDTARLLAFYSHVVPGSMNDGDVDSARYVVWKYRSKKEKLWKTLEKKYGQAVRQTDDWDDYDNGEGDEGETEDLDDSDPNEPDL